MHRRVLGHSGLEVSAVGLGCMGFSHGYGPGPGPNEAISLIREAVDLGCTFFDTAEGYGTGANEELLGRALAPIRDQVVIATKFRVGAPATRDELAQQVRAYLQASLARLRTDRIELYYWHWGAAPHPRRGRRRRDGGPDRRVGCQKSACPVTCGAANGSRTAS